MRAARVRGNDKELTMEKTHHFKEGQPVEYVGKAFPAYRGMIGRVTTLLGNGQVSARFDRPVGRTCDGLAIYQLVCNPCAIAPVGTPTADINTAAPTDGIQPADPVEGWEGHAATIELAQGYVSDPDMWNPPSPAQVAHLLALSGISHGPIAAEKGRAG